MSDLALNDSEHLLFDELELMEHAMERHYEWAFEQIAPELGDAVLEVGSGAGVISKFLEARAGSLILSDYHPAYLARLRERFGASPHVRFQLLDLTAPRYDLESPVDTVVCLNVLEHISDDGHALAEFARLLPPGGRLLLQVPNYPALFGSLDESYGHCRRYRRRGLAKLLEANGFAVRQLRPFNLLGIPGWILSGKILRLSRLNPASIRLFNRLVPLARRLDSLFPLAGLALIASAERR